MDTRTGKIYPDKLSAMREAGDFAAPVETELTARQLKTMKIGRNDPCPCGSGKKFKKCCLFRTARSGRIINPSVVEKANALGIDAFTSMTTDGR